MFIQAFKNISSLVIFRLSSCDSSPPLRLAVSGSSKVPKMSYTHPNSILLVAMSFMRQEEEMIKIPFWNFQADQLWPFNFRPKSSNSNILVSPHWKTEDSSGKLEIERRHGEKPIFEILSVSPPEVLVALQLPLGLISSPGPRRNFQDKGFHFFTQIYHFLSNLD